MVILNNLYLLILLTTLNMYLRAHRSLSYLNGAFKLIRNWLSLSLILHYMNSLIFTLISSRTIVLSFYNDLLLRNIRILVLLLLLLNNHLLLLKIYSMWTFYHSRRRIFLYFFELNWLFIKILSWSWRISSKLDLLSLYLILLLLLLSNLRVLKVNKSVYLRCRHFLYLSMWRRRLRILH